MCPKQPNALTKQGGFLIPVALFIVVGLGALALTITRMGSANGSNMTLASITAQALYAADSGGQFSAHRILFNVQSRGQADANCTSINDTQISFTAAGLSGCQVALSCSRSAPGGTPKRLYAVQSTATCGGGDLVAVRQIALLLAYDRAN
jgi:MSHA biogenesis protein MshP